MSVNNDNFLINESDLNIAQKICNSIENGDIRNRAVANVLASEISQKYFEDIDLDIKSGIHNVIDIIEKFDISDIYIDGNYIDVRLFFEGNDLCVPKIHFDMDILPVAYMFIKIETDLSSGNVIGFISPSDVKCNNDVDGYYQVNEEDLSSFYDIQNQLSRVYEEDLPSDFEELMFDYLDGKTCDEKNLFKILISSKDARNALINAEYTKKVLNAIDLTLLSSAQTDSQTHADEMLNNSLAIESTDDLNSTNNDDVLDVLSENLNEIIEISSDELNNNNLGEESAFENSEILEELIDEDSSSVETDTVHIDEEDDLTSFVKFDYTTEVTTGSIKDYDDDIQTNNEIEDSLENNVISESSTNENIEDDICDLFNDQGTVNDTVVSEEDTTNKKKKSLVAPICILALVALLGYYSYTKFVANQLPNQEPQTDVNYEQQQGIDKTEKQPVTESQKTTAMPLETVENVPKTIASNEGTSASIPAIEQNIDASILISNLSVSWEVPTSYTNNPTAKRYFVKIGKILQLNLKTELLLMTKPPITNKISIELGFDNNMNKFVVKNIVASSGEPTIDNAAKRIAQSVLDMNLGANMSVFNSLKGNPVLVIKL